MLFEKCTVITGHTSTPIRISGNVAALLPTWPYATEDWIDRMRFTKEASEGADARLADRDRRHPGDVRRLGDEALDRGLQAHDGRAGTVRVEVVVRGPTSRSW